MTAGCSSLSASATSARAQAQTLDNTIGKIVRINPDGSIPPDNPFVGRAGALPEIWSYGHRNVQGAALHPVTGELWANEHGPKGGDELNRVLPGRNYGWPTVSYGTEYTGGKISDSGTAPGIEPPVHYWVPSIATSGLMFYTGERFPAWRGSAFVGGLKSQQLVRLRTRRRSSGGGGAVAARSREGARPRRRAGAGWLHLPADRRGERTAAAAAARGKALSRARVRPELNMKSARIHAYTQQPADIRIEDVPIPEPGPGQVRVRMRMSPVNPSDLNFVRGTYHQALERIIWNQRRVDGDSRVYFDPERSNACPEPPYALGGEGVGVVDACGDGFLARRLRGRRVAVASGPPNGTWQEYTVVDAKRAVAMPDRIADEQAAMFFVNPITAYVMIREVLKVRRGGWVLITAAGSALGKSVVRMGRRDGFRTICVVRSSANAASLAALGADAVIETDHQDLVAEVARVTGGRGVGYALDCVGGELTGDVVRCLGLDGRLVIYGTLADSPLQIPGRDLMMPVAQVSGFLLPNWMALQSPLKLLGVLRAVKRLTIEGVFHTEVSETYPLEQAAAAVAAALMPGRTGKVMLRMG